MLVLCYENMKVPTKWRKQKMWMDISATRIFKSSALHAEFNDFIIELTIVEQFRCKSFR